MKKTVLVAMIAAALALAGLHHHHALAQAPAATDKGATDKSTTNKGDAKASKASDRKAKRDEAKKERAEKKAKASAARAAVRERQKQCGAEWRQARKDGKVEKGMTWPKFWSACNTRLKSKTG